MIVNYWADVSSDPISIGVIRNLFSAEDGYRFFPNTYEAGVRFPTHISRSIRIYVLSGSCFYRTSEMNLNMSAGQFADLPPGDYEFEAGNIMSVEIVKAFKIPENDNAEK